MQFGHWYQQGSMGVAALLLPYEILEASLPGGACIPLLFVVAPSLQRSSARLGFAIAQRVA